jgi:hypothetical protein
LAPLPKVLLLLWIHQHCNRLYRKEQTDGRQNQSVNLLFCDLLELLELPFAIHPIIRCDNFLLDVFGYPKVIII